MSARPHPSAVLAQCHNCEWQGWVTPLPRQAYQHARQPDSPQYLIAGCPKCTEARLIDRSTQAPSNA